ncbi:glutathione S-transferase family protein [Peristeroidobacter agariperforans]|uniref:glutathione S-transferase family protein n=1 Tax=Peristeroidobacter agariperforans TaxID=268404 RepID=UPI00101BEE39|nr:glutathione S-transferase family protein [Peristeroidobacter agariperforans]
MPTLYHCADARSLRVLWALEELDLQYELKVLPYPPRQKAPEFLQINPVGTVPYLVDGDTTMNESTAILQYIAVKHGDGKLAVASSDPAYGAWLNWLAFGEAALTVPLAAALRFSFLEPEDKRQPALAEGFRSTFFDKLGAAEAALANSKFLCADRFTVADISVGYNLHLAARMRLLERMSPRIQAYFAELQARPAYQRAKEKQKAA